MSERLYESHKGTVRVGGKSDVAKAAWYVVRLLEQNIKPIEVLFIGANAGHQAAKICSLAKAIASDSFSKNILFSPHKVKTDTKSLDIAGRPQMDEEGHERHSTKDAFVWEVLDMVGDEHGASISRPDNEDHTHSGS